MTPAGKAWAKALAERARREMLRWHAKHAHTEEQRRIAAKLLEEITDV